MEGAELSIKNFEKELFVALDGERTFDAKQLVIKYEPLRYEIRSTLEELRTGGKISGGPWKNLTNTSAGQLGNINGFDFRMRFTEAGQNWFERNKDKILMNNNVSEGNSANLNWIAIFNRLFEAINIQGDPNTYFSGPRFINTVREFDPYHADYQQYINLRNEQGKSTSRKIFYYDILMSFEEVRRIAIVDRILESLRPFKAEVVSEITNLIRKTNSTPDSAPTPALVASEVKNEVTEQIEPTTEKRPIVFISYSWDDEPHKKWVLSLADKLIAEAGVDVRLDRYELKAGKNIPLFIENSIAEADRIIVIYTPNYKLRADKRQGGVGYEYSILNRKVYEANANGERLIPVLRAGGIAESIPEYMQQLIHIDMTKDENFDSSFQDVIREIYNEPEIKKPEFGDRPLFDSKVNKITEELHIQVIDKNGNVVQ